MRGITELLLPVRREVTRNSRKRERYIGEHTMTSPSTHPDSTNGTTDESTAETAPEPSYDPDEHTFDRDDRDASYVHDYPSQAREIEAGTGTRRL